MFKEYIPFIILVIILMFGLGYHLYTIYNDKKNNINLNNNDNKNNNDNLNSKEPFIKSNTFMGYKSGYVFKNDINGLGYYLDKIFVFKI